MARTSGDLAAGIARRLREQIASGTYASGDKLPSEQDLCEAFEVSRPTIRAALRELEVLGLVKRQHGVGTFVLTPSVVRSGIEKLTSITESIRAAGKEPGMIYGARTRRLVLPEEARRMGLPSDTEVLELRRTVTADDVTVAYSFDLVPMSVFPANFDPNELTGSFFHYLERELGFPPVIANAEIHAVESDHIGWGPESGDHKLFILLDQIHYAANDLLVMYSRTYFVEGAFTFEVIRRV